jgi:hypothetical protein
MAGTIPRVYGGTMAQMAVVRLKYYLKIWNLLWSLK